MGKSGGCAASQSEAIGRLVSLAFRCNIEPEKIAKQLSSISCHKPSWDNGLQILSCADGIAKSIQLYVKSKENLKKAGLDNTAVKPQGMNNKEFKMEFEEDSIYASLTACPDCGSHSLEHINGCDLCLSCGYSHC